MRDLHLGLATRSLECDGRAQRGLPRSQWQGHGEVAPFEPVARMRDDSHDEVQVARRRAVASPAPLTRQPNTLPVGNSRRDGDVQRPATTETLERDGADATVERLLDGELDLRLLVGALDRAPTSSAPTGEQPFEEIVDVDSRTWGGSSGLAAAVGPARARPCPASRDRHPPALAGSRARTCRSDAGSAGRRGPRTPRRSSLNRSSADGSLFTSG